MKLVLKMPIWKKQISKMSFSKISMLKKLLSKKTISEMPIFKMLENHAQSRLILVAGLSGLLVWGVLVLAPQPLIIKVDGQPMVYRSLSRTVGSVLAAAGVKLGPRDAVQPDLGTMVSRGMVISVNRAVKLRVNVDGKSMLIWSPRFPVQEVLQEAQVSLGPMDQVSPSLNQMVAAGTVIKVSRVVQRLVKENYEVPVPVQRMNDPQMEMGQSRLVRDGTPGEGQRMLMVTYVNGNPIQQLLIKDTVLHPPLSRMIAFGTVTSASRGGRTFQFHNTMEALATAYSSNLCRYTCTGQLARFGVAAVDPSVIPLGTRLYVDGYGYATAEDIGSAIRGNRIDLFFESVRDCVRWGRRYTKVYELDA